MSETRTWALEKHRSHFTYRKTLPRFTAPLNTEKVVSDVPFWAPRKPRAKAAPWRNLYNSSKEVPEERSSVGRGWTVANKAPSIGTPASSSNASLHLRHNSLLLSS